MSFREALAASLALLLAGDADVLSAVLVSLRVALAATFFSSLAGIPIGFLVVSRSFRGRRAVEIALRTLTAVPTVVIGLIVYTLLSRRGPLGGLELLYTETAMILGSTLLVVPLMATLTMAVVSHADPRIEETALTLGASRTRAALTVLIESRRGLLAAVASGFGRLISELGVALMVGGNIARKTRTMTTAIALETGKGDFPLAFALGLVLLGVALGVNLVVYALSQEGR